MEALITHEIETKRDGIKIVRNFFINSDKTNFLLKSQCYFKKDEKIEAKENYKISLKNKQNHNQERQKLVECLIKQPFPNWNFKVSFLN